MNKITLVLSLLLSSLVFSQKLQPGNVIPEYGKTYVVASPGYITDTTSTLKVVFDVNRSFSANEPNKLIETAARFLNMHENAGVDPGNMEVALVIHGNAVRDVLKDEYYQTEFPGESTNPNLPLLKSLYENGVKIIVCGQSANHYGVSPKRSNKHAQFALSAMTALVQLQNDNYRIINF